MLIRMRLSRLRGIQTLLASLLLHLLLMVGVSLHPALHREDPIPPISREIRVTRVVTHRARDASEVRSGRVRLGALGVNYFRPQAGAQNWTADSLELNAIAVRDRLIGTGDGGDALRELKPLELRADRWVQSRVEALLSYPSELIAAQKTGEVSVEIEFDRNGALLPQRTRYRFDDRYLKVHVARVLRRAFRDAGPVAGRKFALRFRFYFSENGNPEFHERMRVAARGSIHFARWVHRSSLQWSVGPVSGLGPLPAIGINPMWFVEKAKDLLSNDAKIDPLDRYRMDPAW